MNMPPDVQEKSTVNRNTVKLFDKKQPTDMNQVRTEYIVKNIMAYLLKNEYELPYFPPQNSNEISTIEAFKVVVDMFKSTYAASMTDLSASLDVTPSTLSCVILGVSSELFSEGINWSKIATFFVFVSELTIQCLRKDFPEFIVQEILETCIKFIHMSLEKWISEHNGWEGMIEFSKGHKTGMNGEQQSSSNTLKTGSWAKNALYGTVKVLGTLAHLAILSDPMRY